MIGLEPAERFFQLLHRNFFCAAVGADLGHDKRGVAFTLERRAEPRFADSVVILPGVIEEIDSGGESARDELIRFVLILDRAEMVSADTQCGHLCAGLAEGPVRDLVIALGSAGFRIASERRTRYQRGRQADRAFLYA